MGRPAPRTAAARTRRIRLSTAITIVPLEHPVRLAEDVSVVDTLSGGRVEIGVGSGSGPAEYAAFGKDFEQRRELTTAGLHTLRAALAGAEVADGFRIQPPPRSDFSDRLWQGIFSEAGARFTAQEGSNLLLNRATYGYEEDTDVVQRGWADAYLAEWNQPRRPRIGLSRMVATDLITQFNPGIPDFDAAVDALRLIATEIAPALGWQPQQPRNE